MVKEMNFIVFLNIFSFEIKEKHDRRTFNLFFLFNMSIKRKNHSIIFHFSFDKQFKIVLSKVFFIKNEIIVIKTGPS